MKNHNNQHINTFYGKLYLEKTIHNGITKPIY